MLKGIYEAASGMLPQVLRQNIVANNLANANTAGFKRDLVFSQEFTKAQQKTLPKRADWEKSHVTETMIDFAQGSIERTGNPLHLAIEGDAFFAISTPEGEMYTRGGNFAISQEGTLVTYDGNPVLSEAGEVAVAGDELVVGPRGEITVDGRPAGMLRLVTFGQPYPLARAAGGLLALVPGSPEPTRAEDFNIVQGALESSNVNIISQMVEMIESFRAFETGQRMVQIQDESLGKAVNQLGTLRG